ncbi:MAG: hypothetical protein HY898_03205 [Deltaproteobacteria bacterium]|nr:hypothetical protein [Deltaproteobacteria bacterium]
MAQPKAAMWLRVAVWTTLGLAALCGIAACIDVLAHDIPSDPVEPTILAAQVGLSHGVPLYASSSWQAPPYQVNLYGPVFYYLGAWALRGLGQGVSFLPGRLVSLCALMACLAALWRFSRHHLQLPRAYAAGALVLSMGYPVVSMHAVLNRVDMVAVALAICGFVLAQERGKKSWFSPVLLVLALYTKPTAIAAPAAVFMTRLWRNQRRAAMAFAVSCVALAAIALAGLWLQSDGGFVTAVFVFNRNHLHVQGGLDRIQLAAAALTLPLACALALSSLANGKEMERPVSVYLLLATCVAFLVVLNVGAYLNVFLESGMIMGPVLSSVLFRQRRNVEIHCVALAAGAITLVASARGLQDGHRDREERMGWEPELRRIMTGKRVLTVDCSPALRVGAELMVIEPYIFTRLVESHRIDPDAVLAMIREEKVDVIATGTDLERGTAPAWSPAMRETILAHYRLRRAMGNDLFLYQPRHVEPNPSTDDPTRPARIAGSESE